MCQLHEIVQLRTWHIAYVICTKYVRKISETQNSNIKEILMELLITCFINI